MHPLLRVIQKESRLVIGIMSGTSADGVDAALARISGYGETARVAQLAFHFSPFPSDVRAEILRLAGGESATARDFCQMNFLLGRLYCEAGDALCREAGVRADEIDLIGCHGQTVWHIPKAENYLGAPQASTLQIGEDALLAEHFRCPVAGDFRVRDMAAGGLGAPLVPYTEYLLYKSDADCVALQNLGGIGNITVMPAGCRLDEVTAFDTGPGNMVMDALAARMTNGRMAWDEGGKMAASGAVSPALLAYMLEDEYLYRRPPKTTGRERYGKAYVDRLLQKADALGVSLVSALATSTRFTAETVRLAINRLIPARPARLIVGGGGAMNPTLMGHLKALLPDCRVMTQEELGFNSNAKEAVAFAILANEAIFASPNNAPSATGARHPVVMGKISF